MLPDSLATDRAGGKRIRLGLCGSVAAVRALDLVRDLAGIGIETHVTATEASAQFVTQTSLLSFGAASYSTQLFSDQNDPFPHLDLETPADAFLVLAATANTMAKLACGLADNLLTTQALASTGPKFIAPAMNTRMWEHPTVQRNAEVLARDGFHFIGPDSGLLACRESGKGKLAPVHQIAACLLRSLFKKPLQGKQALVTLGATREHFDPVRFISNPSSGLMGACIAHVLWFLGADVTVVDAYSSAFLSDELTRLNVESAAEMHDAVMDLENNQDILCFVAAVSDYTTNRAEQKVKKTDETLTLQCTPTQDIARSFGGIKKAHQISIGFAAETNDLLTHMRAKLEKKNFDLIVGNNVASVGSGFGSLTNQAVLLDRKGCIEHLPLLSKMELAHRVGDWLTGCIT